jgi:hypothetical protein
VPKLGPGERCATWARVVGLYRPMLRRARATSGWALFLVCDFPRFVRNGTVLLCQVTGPFNPAPPVAELLWSDIFVFWGTFG